MGAPRVTPQEIVEMHRLYAKLGTYAAVGRIMGRSAGTISKYIQMNGVPVSIKMAVNNLMQKEVEPSKQEQSPRRIVLEIV